MVRHAGGVGGFARAMGFRYGGLQPANRQLAKTRLVLASSQRLGLSFALFYRVFHVLLYLGELEGGPEIARYLATELPEAISELDKQEQDIEKLTEALLGQ